MVKISAIDESRCKAMVSGLGGWHRYQCLRRAVRDGFCQQHHPTTVAARREKSEREYEEKRKRDPVYRLIIALNRIKKLEAENKRLKAEIQQIKRDYF